MKRVNAIHHGETQGSCDFVTKASPCSTAYFKSCLVCDLVVLNRRSSLFGGGKLFSYFLSSPRFFFVLDVSPGPLQGLNESVDMKEEQVDEYKKNTELAFSVWVWPPGNQHN